MNTILRTLLLLFTCLSGLAAGELKGPIFEQLLPLKPEEGVFAYSRISPDGRYLSYASEIREKGQFLRTVNIVDLATKRIVYSDPGMDAYWAPDGGHLIYLRQRGAEDPVVCIWNRQTGVVTEDVAPESLGHYFSWGQRDGQNWILTQENRYYLLENSKAVKPYRTVPAFPPLGQGTQPMISKDGRTLATFYKNTLLIRSLEEAEPVLETRLPGGKADFSYDGRYVAFHATQSAGGRDTYQILVVDLKTKEYIKVTNLPGSCYYPSWTRDGRLSFRYDYQDYRGFMIASKVLDGPRFALPTTYPDTSTTAGALSDLVKGPRQPTQKVVMVNFWAGWCVHCRGELPVLNKLRQDLKAGGHGAEIIGACDPTSFKTDREDILRRSNLDLPQIDVSSKEVNAFGIQVYPTTLIFVGGKLVEKRQGALSRKAAVALFKKYGVQLEP